MRMGLENAGWDVVFANDIMPDKEKMYRDHFGGEAGDFTLGDIHKLSSDDIPDCTLATASFPCTDLSLAGGRKGLSGKQSSAFWGFVDVIKKMGKRRPPVILLENVTGFMTSRGGEDFASALTALNQLGYSVDAFIVNATHFVPQSRVRLFVVGVSQDLSTGCDIAESPGFFEDEVRPKSLSDFVFTHPKIIWDMRPLPALPTTEKRLKDIVDYLPDDSPLWWSAERTDYLISQMVGGHADRIAQMRAGEKLSFGTVFRRVRKGKTVAELRTDGIAGCLRTPKGGSARQILVQAGYGKVNVRLISPRECARLMGADDYKIDVPFNQALFGFGDAVCVPVVTWIAENYLIPLVNELKQMSSPPSAKNWLTAAGL